MNASPINECNRIPGDGVTYAVAQFELTRQWGEGKTAAADGTHFETYEDNLLAEHHIRYGKSGGIAYRHIPDNYIALFSRFIACGTYEATFILDALLRNLSDLQPKRVHADTHGQSAAVFGLAYLLGIELLPRIRRWRELKLYRSEHTDRCSCIEALFSGTVNWSLIREHYGLFMQLAQAIQSGTLAPSAVLARINSYSTRNRLALALHALAAEGVAINHADLAFLSPYATSNLKRFGDYPQPTWPQKLCRWGWPCQFVWQKGVDPDRRSLWQVYARIFPTGLLDAMRAMSVRPD